MVHRMVTDTYDTLNALSEPLRPFLVPDLCKLCVNYATNELLMFERVLMRTMLQRRRSDYHLKSPRFFYELAIHRDKAVQQYMALFWKCQERTSWNGTDRIFMFSITFSPCPYYCLANCRRRNCFLAGNCTCGDPIL
jgi:hypothetical protein